jgi:hypothetical protein
MKKVIGGDLPEVLPMAGEHLAGKVLVLNDRWLSNQFRSAEYQLWKATGGFGCNPAAMGTAVFAVCLNDGERARWERGDFIGIASPELIAEFYPEYKGEVE